MNELHSLHAIHGGWEDQVVRRQRFEVAHRDVRILPVGGAWQAILPTKGGEDVITRYELRHLLDELERRLGGAAPTDPKNGPELRLNPTRLR